MDVESHTSVALAQVLWHYQFNRRLRIVPFTPGRWDVAEDAQAVLLIGDKVVTDSPIGFNFQFDLGRLWFEMTGLPFVFAVWTAAEGSDCEAICRVLAEAPARPAEHRRDCAAMHRSTAGPKTWRSDISDSTCNSISPTSTARGWRNSSTSPPTSA